MEQFSETHQHPQRNASGSLTWRGWSPKTYLSVGWWALPSAEQNQNYLTGNTTSLTSVGFTQHTSSMSYCHSWRKWDKITTLFWYLKILWEEVWSLLNSTTVKYSWSKATTASLLVTTSPLQSGLPFLSIQAESTTWQLNFTSEHTKLASRFQWTNTESVARKPKAYAFVNWRSLNQ